METSEEKFVTVARFNNASEASILKGKLEAAGIDCFLDNENFLYSRPMGCVNLNVWEKDRDKAMSVLQIEILPGDEVDDDEAVICPYCKSKNTTYGINRNVASIFYVVGAFFLQSLPFYKKKIYYCNNCKRHFKIEEKD